MPETYPNHAEEKEREIWGLDVRADVLNIGVPEGAKEDAPIPEGNDSSAVDALRGLSTTRRIDEME